ncbi:MAG: hypothetical protein ABIR32_04505 [Ilumatobacteraceae bacterium]
MRGADHEAPDLVVGQQIDRSLSYVRRTIGYEQMDAVDHLQSFGPDCCGHHGKPCGKGLKDLESSSATDPQWNHEQIGCIELRLDVIDEASHGDGWRRVQGGDPSVGRADDPYLDEWNLSLNKRQDDLHQDLRSIHVGWVRHLTVVQDHRWIMQWPPLAPGSHVGSVGHHLHATRRRQGVAVYIGAHGHQVGLIYERFVEPPPRLHIGCAAPLVPHVPWGPTMELWLADAVQSHEPRIFHIPQVDCERTVTAHQLGHDECDRLDCHDQWPIPGERLRRCGAGWEVQPRQP